ncbi:hypothetical protein CEE60_00445 [Stenotrophomonas maltophilia]|jgi:hypothetical protein|uniref:YdhG-like domain-containing protein n=2 Tax=Lysobacteraceae TaxID=32033 RepID=A0A246HS22_STEMA|nr:DUF1801 domain-containing protein [Stenotrophomonas sp.]OWQ57309.1 hypothetical protein CEE60_00445 [Stenotrophomonas maltophilia]
MVIGAPMIQPNARSTPRAAAASEPSASQQIDARIQSLDDWRGEALSNVRALIRKAAPDVVETWKWRGVPVWEDHGILCTGETYKAAVKLTFARGASLPDPKGLFNASLEGNTRRAIDLHEGDTLNATAFKALIRAAIARNRAAKPPAAAARAKASQRSA